MNTTQQVKAWLHESRRLIANLQAARATLKQRGPGKYAGGTVYTVKATRVRAHMRSGYVAVRLKDK